MEQLGHSITYIKQMYTLWAKNEGLDNVHVLWILCSLLRHPHRSQQEICTDFFIPKQTLSPICKNLLKEGIIEPVAVCLDKREKRIQLTKKGRAFAEPLMSRLNMLENKVFTWEDAKPLRKGKYMMMHSLIYRLDILKQSKLQLPEHTFYVDNLFVFILIFNFFKVPRELHHKVLFWGIVGALIFRAIFIFAGVGLINITYLPEMDLLGKVVKINPILTIFGVFLVYAGIKSWKEIGKENEEEDYSDKMGAKLVKRFYKVSDQYDGDKFFTIKDGVKYATPLLVVVTVIEFSDVLFAVDSIPAIFAISEDPFILYTSNIFAILGLRSLYFLLFNFIHMFDKLPYGLAIILSFIGLKMLISPWLHISSPVSLGIVAGVLLVSVVLSLMYTEDKK